VTWQCEGRINAETRKDALGEPREQALILDTNAPARFPPVVTPGQVATLVNAVGVAAVPGVLTACEVEFLITALGEVTGAGVRGVLRIPAFAELATSPRLLDLARPLLPEEPRPVRAIYFDKSLTSNWLVPWHQDLTLAVRERADLAGFGPWSVKDGVPHVQAPASLLEKMITIRLHLDPCDEYNGALKVLTGSHKFGIVPADRIKGFAMESPELVCRVGSGWALVMRPLLLHSSSRSSSDGHRRVLHIEYAGFDLPQPLQWLEPRPPTIP